MPKLPRLETIVEKGCELGLDELWIFPAEKGEKKELQEKQKQRLNAIAIAACKQSGRLWLPKIVYKDPLAAWKEAHSGFFGDLSPNARSLIEHLNDYKRPLIAIGPESGFSDKEIKKMVDLGLKGVKLGRYILRTDTAALSALSVLGLGYFK